MNSTGSRDLGPCEEWTQSRNFAGYGLRWDLFKHRYRKAHRMAWEDAHGPIPEGMLVRHKCDNPPCIRVDHLELGTYADNNNDRVKRGRSNPPRGERSSNAKLTEDEVRAIRAASGTTREIGAKFGVTHSHVSKLRRGQMWEHLQEAKR